MSEEEKFDKKKQKIHKLFENYYKPIIFNVSWEKEGVQVSTNIY